MSIQYLRVSEEEAYTTLDDAIVKGYSVRDLIWQHSSSGGEPLVLEKCEVAYREWYNQVSQRLAEVYSSRREHLTFLHLPGSGLAYGNLNYSLSGVLSKIDVRQEYLRSLMDTLTNKFELHLNSGRDTNVQVGGTQNTQHIENEG